MEVSSVSRTQSNSNVSQDLPSPPEQNSVAPKGVDQTLWNLSTPAERATLTANAAAAADLATRIDLAKQIVKAGGSGTQADVDLVVAELAKMPETALRSLIANNTTVIACRNSITDYRTDLKGVQPRGWPSGATWDSVPGVANSGRNEVVIAVIGHGTTAGAHVPKTGEGHGSANLVIHEVAHAIDSKQTATRNSSSTDFNTARNADLAALPAYETQAGVAGKSETYAESAARYYSGNHGSISTPALDAYWRSNPLGGK
jgi:hypothetical protein